MVQIFSISEDNKLAVILLAATLILDIIVFIIYPNPTFRTACAIYGFLALVSISIYTNPAFQEHLYGIPKNTKTLWSIAAGAAIGLGFVFLPRLLPGFSIGIPLLPASVADNFKFIIIGVFAPVFEDFVRFSILGIVKYIRREDGISQSELWLAILVQAMFFTAIHALAYATGFYQAPTWMQALGSLGAVSASLFAAFTFAMVTGYFVTRDGVKNIALSIAAHFVVNGLLFTALAVVF